MRLTPRQLEVCLLIAEGLTQKEAALRMGIALKALESHLERARRSYGAATTAQLMWLLCNRMADAEWRRGQG